MPSEAEENIENLILACHLRFSTSMDVVEYQFSRPHGVLSTFTPPAQRSHSSTILEVGSLHSL